MDYDVNGALAEMQATPGQEQVSFDTTVQAPVVTPAETMFDLKRNGEIKQFPQSKVIDFAQQGFDYNVKMADFNSQRTAWENERKKTQQNFDQLKARYDYLDKVDQYATQNPQWLASIQAAYSQVTSPQNTQDNPLLSTVSTLQEKLKTIEETLGSQAEAAQAKKQAEEDAALDGIITTYKTANGHFDWASQDPVTGQTLEQKIIQHAVTEGIKSFKAAANDYLFEEHLAKAKGQAKESVAKEIQKKSLLGLGPVTALPTQGVKANQNFRTLSYEQLAAEGLKELGG